MNHKANVSREPLNVLGCQWPGADGPTFPKSASAYFMGAKAGHETSTASSSSQEAMDLKLDNERRLHELREQGKQCLLNRNEQNTKEEGAANVVVRFHTMPWINNPLNPLSEFSAGISRPNRRAVDNGQVNLIPVKHGEEEYFPGTRQQKKPRRPKNVRTKCETLKLEEVPPCPKDKILPAGFVPPVSAWSVRKGSELFDSRKLSLTLYGPDDEEALYQRALQESMVTLYEEQDRIVNMFSPYHGDNSRATCAAFEQPKEEVEACAVQAPDTGGAGDGSWVKNEALSRRSRNETKMDTASESQDLVKGRFLAPEDSIHGRNRSRDNYGNGKEKSSNWTKCSYNRTQSDKSNVEYDFKKSVKEENKEAKLESLGFNKSRTAQHAHRETSRKREDKRNSERFEKRQLQEPFASSGGDPTRFINARDRHIKFADPLVQPPKTGRSWAEELNENDDDPWSEAVKQTDLPSETTVCFLAQIQPSATGCEKLFFPKKCDRSDQGSKVTPVRTEVTISSRKSPDLKKADIEETTLEVTKEFVRTDPIKNGSSPRRDSISSRTGNSAGHLEVSSTVEVSILGDSQEKEEKMKKMREELEFLDNRLKQLSSALEQTHLEGSVPLESPSTKTEPSDSRERQEVPVSQVPPMSTSQVPPMSTSQIPPMPALQGPPMSTSPIPPMPAWQGPPMSTSQGPPMSTSPVPPVSLVPPTKAMPKEENTYTDGSLFNVWLPTAPNSLPHLMCPQQLPQQLPRQLPQPTLVPPPGHPFARLGDHAVAVRSDCPVVPGQAQMIRPQTHPQGPPQITPEDRGQTHPQGHSLVHGQGLAQAFPAALQAPFQLYSQGSQRHSSTQPQPDLPAGPQLHQQAHTQAQEITIRQMGEHKNPSHSSMHPEALPAHLQQRQEAPITNAKAEQTVPIARVVAEQQYMAMQGAAVAAAAAAAGAAYPPACAPNNVPLVWLGLGPQLPPGASNLYPQMRLPPGPALESVQAASGEDSNSTNVTPEHAVAARAAKAGCMVVENTGEGKPVGGGEIPAAHSGPMFANPLAAAVNSLPRSQIPMTPDSIIQNGVNATTANVAPGTEAEAPAHMQWFAQMKALQQQQLLQQQHLHQHLQQQQQQLLQQQQEQASGAGVENPASAPGGSVPVEWLARMKALQQQQQQQQMMHLASMVPGMRPSLPIHQLPVPFMATGVRGLGWPVCSPVAKIPPQYEGDWIISPADESRLAQGLPLVSNEIHKDLSPGRRNAPGFAQFSDAAENSTGSEHVLVRAESGSLKVAHPPVPLTGLTQPTVNAQVNVNPAVAVSAESVFHNVYQAPMQLVKPSGLQRRGKANPDEPRGRGRLR